MQKNSFFRFHILQGMKNKLNFVKIKIMKNTFYILLFLLFLCLLFPTLFLGIGTFIIMPIYKLLEGVWGILIIGLICMAILAVFVNWNKTDNSEAEERMRKRWEELKNKKKG